MAATWGPSPTLANIVPGYDGPPATHPDELGERGRTLLALIAAGYDDAQIAARLCREPRYIRQCVGYLYRRLPITGAAGNNKRVLAARWYWEHSPCKEGTR